MNLRSRFALGFAAALLLAGPASADKVLTLRSHTDAMKMMGQTTPAQDIDQLYWFGDDAVRFDAGNLSTVIQISAKKLIYMDHDKKTYSVLDLPVDFKKLVPPEMAPMMEQMTKMMAASVQVTPEDRRGEFAGVACKYSKVDVSMGMMQMSMDMCMADALDIDFGRFDSLRRAQAEMLPNSGWMKDLSAKLTGFPVRTDSTTVVMGKEVKSSQELVSIDDRAAPEGFYGTPAGYSLVDYNPMARGEQRRK